MAKVVTFGELMLRLAPNGYYRFFKTTNAKQPSAAVKPTLQFLLLTAVLTRVFFAVQIILMLNV